MGHIAGLAFHLMISLVSFPQVESRPAGPDARLQTADRTFAVGDYRSAVQQYESIGYASLPIEAVNRLGIAYQQLGRPRDAEGTYRVAIVMDRDSSTAFNNLGALYYAQEEFRDAEKQFTEALSREPDNEIYLRNLRMARYARENGRVVRRLIEGARETNPQLVEGVDDDRVSVATLIPEEDRTRIEQHEVRGDVFQARKFFGDAIVEYEQAIQIDKHNVLLVNKLGIAYLQNGDLHQAERAFKNVLDLNPYFAPAFNNLGAIEHLRGEYLLALDYYLQYLEVQGPSANLLRNVGGCLFALERYEEGLAVFLEALALDPSLFDRPAGLGAMVQIAEGAGALFNFYMAKVFAQSGDADRAMSHLYRAVDEGFEDAQLVRDPAFDLLAGDERFRQLLASLEDPSYSLDDPS